MVPPNPAHRREVAISQFLRSCLFLWLASCGTGCVRIYQPMSGLHRPVVVDPTLANFQDLRLAVHCVPEDLLNPADAAALCQKVETLFENQGAEVTTAGMDSVDDTGQEEEGTAPADDAPTTDLTLELRAHRVHQANNLLSWALCIGTFTLVPAVTESTFAQDVVIRDGTGFLLVSDSLEGRLVLRFGAGTWVANKLLDLAWRDDADKLTGDAFNHDLSTDLYRQLSQMMFNAEMQWQILQQAPSARATRGTR